MRKIVLVAAPFIVLLSAWAAAARAELLSTALQSLFYILPYIFALLVLILSAWYQNSNSFFLACSIFFYYIFINVISKTPSMIYEAVTIVSIFLPLNAVWLGFSQERGIISSYGRNKAIIIFGQIIWALININAKSNVSVPADINDAVMRLKVPAVALYVLCISVLLLNYFLKKHYMSLVFVVILLTSFIMLHFANRPIFVAIFTSAILLNIVIALLDMSYSIAFYDSLTGVLSRRAFEQELFKLGNKYAIAIIDLDHFKQINDNYGHDVGDQVLKMVASILSKTAGYCKVFRYGGEEFVVLFTGMSYNIIWSTLEQMRKTIERRPFILRDKNRPVKKPENVNNSNSALKEKKAIYVTVSIGVAHKNNQLKTCYDVIKKADEALYKSKKKGRNCITMI